MKKSIILLYSLVFIGLSIGYHYQKTLAESGWQQKQAQFAEIISASIVESENRIDQSILEIEKMSDKKPHLDSLKIIVSEVAREEELFRFQLNELKTYNDFSMGLSAVKRRKNALLQHIRALPEMAPMKGVKFDSHELKRMENYLNIIINDSTLQNMAKSPVRWELLENCTQLFSTSFINYIQSNMGTKMLCCYGCYRWIHLNRYEPAILGKPYTMRFAFVDNSGCSNRYDKVFIGSEQGFSKPCSWAYDRVYAQKKGLDSIPVRIERYNYRGEKQSVMEEWVKYWVD